MKSIPRGLVLALGAVLVMSAWSAAAADQPPPRPRWGFKGLFTLGDVGSDYGNGLEKYLSGDFEFYRTSPGGSWRFGGGVGFGSFAMKPPYQDEEEFALLRTYFSGTRVFRVDRAIRPYLELQVGAERTHPRSFLFAQRPLPENLEPGDSPTFAKNGWGAAVVPGVEMSLGGSGLSLDASLQFNFFNTHEYDLSPIGQPPASNGTTYGGRIGLAWVPNGGDGGPGPQDPWGVHRSYGWATGEMLAINLVASRVNEYKRAANFNQISPRSWWQNIKDGFDYDDNEFRTNQFIHPINGSMYYNSARANGHEFWVSSAYAIGGAFLWECCGETHPMSFNDMVSTSLGGIAIGEMMYRMSSKILDNTAQGKGRFWREAAAFLVDPMRGFNRQVSGHARADHQNPLDPMDWRPPGGGSFLALGVRTIGRGESISENTKTTGYFEFTHAYGNAFDNERNKPFDSFDLVLQFNFGDKVPLGQAQVVGTLYKKPLGGDAHPSHVFEIAQHYDYMNNTDYEFGGQSFGPSLLSRFDLSNRWTLRTRVDATAMVLGAINSEYAKIAEVGDRERLREYDYGPGLGAAAKATLSRGGRPLLQVGYRFQWINVSNGSVYNNDRLGISTDAHHYIQLAGARLTLPIRGDFGVGVDGTVFFRKSRYSIPLFHDIDQRNPQVRVYLTVNGVR
jgi:hypothetical protein